MRTKKETGIPKQQPKSDFGDCTRRGIYSGRRENPGLDGDERKVETAR